MLVEIGKHGTHEWRLKQIRHCGRCSDLDEDSVVDDAPYRVVEENIGRICLGNLVWPLNINVGTSSDDGGHTPYRTCFCLFRRVSDFLKATCDSLEIIRHALRSAFCLLR